MIARHWSLLLAAVALPAAGALAGPRYRLPPETMPKGEGGAALLRAHCTACHSLDYIATQPPGMGKGFWEAEVLKMKKVYGAPVPDDAGSAIADYLTKER